MLPKLVGKLSDQPTGDDFYFSSISYISLGQNILPTKEIYTADTVDGFLPSGNGKSVVGVCDIDEHGSTEFDWDATSQSCKFSASKHLTAQLWQPSQFSKQDKILFAKVYQILLQ